MGKYSKKGKSKASKPAKKVKQTKQNKQQKQQKQKKTLLTLLCILLFVLLAAIGGMWLMFSGVLDDHLILDNVSVAGVDLSGMTQTEAADAVDKASEDFFSDDMVVIMPDTELNLAASDTGARLDTAAIVEAAYQYGRSGSWSENRKIRENASASSLELALEDYLILNEDFIRSRIDSYCTGYNSEFQQSSLTVEGEMPILDTADENFNPEAPCQTVRLFLGVPGRYVDGDAIFQQILEAYRQLTFQVTVTPSAEDADPEDLTEALKELHEKTVSKAADSVMDQETYKGSYEVYGYTFDLEAALTALEDAGYGDTLEISYEYILPEVTKESLDAMLFRDELASYKTSHSNNSNRTTNLKLACKAIDGLVLMPGEQFDYNKALGKRTAEAGYKAADAYSAGQTVQTIGGGICQVSSTLYYCTLIADLQIDVRKAHSYVSSYMPLGMDATVSWGGPDFRFSNNTNYPLRIEAEVEGGYVKVRLVGTDEKDYYVKMEYEVLSNEKATTVTKEYPPNNSEGYRDGQVITTAYNGCTVQTYKCKYSKETDELISREKEALSQYKKRDKVVVKIVAAPTEAPETPTEAPTEAPA